MPGASTLTTVFSMRAAGDGGWTTRNGQDRTIRDRTRHHFASLRERARVPIRRGRAWAAVGLLRSLSFAARRFPRLSVPGSVRLAGDINKRIWSHPVQLNEVRFGPSMTNPSVLEITIDPPANEAYPTELSPIARRVFSHFPKFVVNVAFSCGQAIPFQPGVYADPRSPWFNIFVGYYQIDVPKSEWEHPFGYRFRDGGFRIWPEDLARLGQADWNFFSNFMYGVPLSALEDRGADAVTLGYQGRIQVGQHWWDKLTGEGISVSSAYVSTADGGALDANLTMLRELWRAAFGQPYEAAEPPVSFFQTPIAAELLVSFDEAFDKRDLKQEVYRTFVFGGSVNEWWAECNIEPRKRHNQAFLDQQMAGIRRLLIREFPNCGFPDDSIIGWGDGAGGDLGLTGTAPPIPPTHH